MKCLDVNLFLLCQGVYAWGNSLLTFVPISLGMNELLMWKHVRLLRAKSLFAASGWRYLKGCGNAGGLHMHKYRIEARTSTVPLRNHDVLQASH